MTGMTRNYHGFGCNLDTPAIKFPINEKVRLFRTLKYFKKTPQPFRPFLATHQHHQKPKQNKTTTTGRGVVITPLFFQHTASVTNPSIHFAQVDGWPPWDFRMGISPWGISPWQGLSLDVRPRKKNGSQHHWTMEKPRV